MQLISDEGSRYDVVKKTFNDDCPLDHGYRITNRSVSLFINLKLADFDQVVNRLSLNFAKDRVLFLKPFTRRSHRHEELRAILVPFTFVGHRDDSSVREGKSLMKLIHKRFSIGAFTALTSASWVSALNHEVFDHPMEDCVVIVAFKAKLEEVTAGTRGLTSPQVNFNLTIVCLKNDFG